MPLLWPADPLPRRPPEFGADVDRFSSGPAWVTEFRYPAVRDLLLARADLLVWLDLPRSVVLQSVVRRTVVRRAAG